MNDSTLSPTSFPGFLVLMLDLLPERVEMIGSVDIQITDAVSRAVIRDTKAERITTEKSELDGLSQKARQRA